MFDLLDSVGRTQKSFDIVAETIARLVAFDNVALTCFNFVAGVDADYEISGTAEQDLRPIHMEDVSGPSLGRL